jgi:predicted lipoprotein with Yx(FWY)xxD motif
VVVRRLVLLTLAVLLAGAGAATARTSSVAVVKTAFNKKLGKTILVDARGRTLYTWTADSKDHSTCVDDPTYHCSKDWPPLHTTGDPVAKGAVKASLLSTFTRDDGTTQVSYNGHPLYTWAGYAGDPPDRKPGDIKGQGYVGLWYVLSPAGTLIKKLPHAR